MANFKISVKVWNGLTEKEKEYVKNRAHVSNLTSIKMFLRDARKKFGEYKRIYGKGFVETATGETWLYNGTDSRSFSKI